MFVSGDIIGLKPHEADGMREAARRGEFTCYAALINATPPLDEKALRAAFKPDAPDPRLPKIEPLMRPEKNVHTAIGATATL